MSLLSTFLEIFHLDWPDTHPLAEDDPDDVAALRRLVTNLTCQLRRATIERDCFRAELLRARTSDGRQVYGQKSLDGQVKMYDRALHTEVRAGRGRAS